MSALPVVDPEAGLLEDIAAYFDDPLGFVFYAFPWGESGPLITEGGPDRWQQDVLREIGEAMEKGATINDALRIAVASGHGIGKTALIAWLILWFVSTREFPQVVVTANTQTQLLTKTWRELAKWHRMMVNAHWFEWTATKFYHKHYPDTWFASAIPWSERNAEAFAGTHEKYVMIIYDEGSGIADIIWETTEGALTTPGAIWVAFGNYTKNTGRFHECFNRFKHRWICHQVDSRTAKKANQTQIQQWIDDYGEDSDFVRIRVRGIAPRAGSNQFIPQDVIDACQKYEAVDYQTMPKILVLDVARFGDDQSVSSVRQGRKFRVKAKWRGLDTAQLRLRFIEHIEEEQPDAIVIDGDGIGGPVIDELTRQGYHKRNGKEILFPFLGGSSPANPERYYNRRAEVWGLMRQALKEGVEIGKDPELAAELAGPEYTLEKRGQYDVILLESKKDMKSRGLSSPDIADTLAMSYSVKILAPPKPKAIAPVYAQRQEASVEWMAT